MDPRRHHQLLDSSSRYPPPVRFSSSPHHRFLVPSPPLLPPPPHHRPPDAYHHHRFDDETRIPPYVPSYPQQQLQQHLLFHASQQKLPPPPASNRVVFAPDPGPDSYSRRIPRELVDEAERVRVRVRRDADPDACLVTQSRLELVPSSRKRPRRVGTPEYVYLEDEDDGLEAWSPVNQKKPVVWAASLRPPFQLQSSETSGIPRNFGLIPPDRYRETSLPAYVADEPERAIERERGYVPKDSQGNDRYLYRERQLVTRGKSIAYAGGGSSSQDVIVAPRKRSVWQRLEEGNPAPLYSPPHGSDSNTDRDREDMPLDFSVSLKSDAFMAREFPLLPPGDALVTQQRDSMAVEKIPVKELIKDSSDSNMSGARDSGDGVRAKKCTIKLVTSDMDAPLSLATADMCSPRTSAPKPVTNGEMTYLGHSKEKSSTECAEELDSKSLGDGKSARFPGEVITKVPVPVRKQVSSSRKVVMKNIISEKICATPSNQSLTLDLHTLPETQKKTGETALGCQTTGRRLLSKIVTTEGTPKRRVIIRKRLVPRGSVKKSDGKDTTERTSSTEMAKAAPSTISNREEVSDIKIVQNNEKPLSFTPYASLIPNANEKTSSSHENFMKEWSADGKITGNASKETMQASHGFSAKSQESDPSPYSKLNLSQEALVSPRKSYLGSLENATAHGKEIPERISIASPVIPLQQSRGRNIAAASKSRIAIKQLDPAALPVFAAEPAVFLKQDSKLSSNNTALTGTSTAKLADKVVRGAWMNNHSEEVVSENLTNKLEQKNLSGNLLDMAEEISTLGNGKPKTVVATEIMEEASVSQNTAIYLDENGGNVLEMESKRKRKESTAICSSINLSVPILPNQSSVATAAVNPMRNQMHSERAQFFPIKKKRRRKKNKKNGSNVGFSLATSQTDETCNTDGLGSFVSQALHSNALENSVMDLINSLGGNELQKSANPCHYQHLVEEACHPHVPPNCSKDVLLSEVGDLFTSSDSTHNHDRLILAERKPISDIQCAKIDDATLQCDRYHETVQKSPQKLKADFSDQKKHVSVGQEERSCKPVKKIEIKDIVFGETVRGQTILESYLPIDGGRPVPFKTTIPFTAGNNSMEESKILQEQLPEATPCLGHASPPVNCSLIDNDKSATVNKFPSSLAHEAAILLVADEVTGKRDEVGFKNVEKEIRIDEEKHTFLNQHNGDNVSINNRVPQPDGLKVHDFLNLTPSKIKKSCSTAESSKICEREGEECRMLSENRLLGSGNLNFEVSVGQSSVCMPLDCNRKEEKSTKQMHDVQIKQPLNIPEGNLNVGISDCSLTEELLFHSKNATIGTDSEKNTLIVTVDADKKKPSYLSKMNAHSVAGSQIVVTENSGLAKNGQDHVKPKVLSQPASHRIRQQTRGASGFNGRHRTWRRTDPSVVPPPPSHLKIPAANSSQRQISKKPERTQGSYVRKGNSLIRKSIEVTPPSQPLPLLGNSSKTTFEMSKGRSLETVQNISDVASSMKSGKLLSTERSKGLPLLSLSLKQLSLYSPELASMDPVNDGKEDQASLSGAPKFDQSILKVARMPIAEELKGSDQKRMVYVKHKSNQLVATKGVDMGSLPSISNINQATPVLSSDLYYTRKNNKLFRDTSSDNLTNRDTLCSVSNLNLSGKREEDLIKRSTMGDAASKGKNFKQSKFSLVWRLNSMHPHGKDVAVTDQREVLPYIFPWKRATYRRTSLINSSKYHSVKLTRKQHIWRKRDSTYTISKGGFSLRKSGTRNICGRNLKWSKSIEKRTKKANEEATLAVAEVEREKRANKRISHACAGTRSRKCVPKERIFRVGNVRYKMDSSKRTLIRIPDDNPSNNQELGRIDLKSIIPRRLMIGHDEYIRVGNGNQLVRDPKQLVRILASEKVRWSLHTARRRLAKKQQYCQFFTRYGKCNKDEKKCPYIHDPTKVAICTKFLKGLCSGTNCNLTHKIIPERMPDCSYFLRGHCTNSSCPYRHVNVNPKASVCKGFLKGYCGDGDECQKKHSYVCPNFETTGKCFQGSDCKLHHPKLKSKAKKRKISEVKVHGSKGRYFGCSTLEVGWSQILASGRITDDDNNGDICSEGRMADYISLDLAFEEESVDNHDHINLLPHKLEPGEVCLFDLNSFIKPIRIMDKKKGGSAGASLLATMDLDL